MFTWLYYSNGAFFSLHFGGFFFCCFPSILLVSNVLMFAYIFLCARHSPTASSLTFVLASSCLMQASRSYCRIMYTNTYFITHSDRQIASPHFSSLLSPFPRQFVCVSFSLPFSLSILQLANLLLSFSFAVYSIGPFHSNIPFNFPARTLPNRIFFYSPAKCNKDGLYTYKRERNSHILCAEQNIVAANKLEASVES